jgi:hypothetical protein
MQSAFGSHQKAGVVEQVSLFLMGWRCPEGKKTTDVEARKVVTISCVLDGIHDVFQRQYDNADAPELKP